MMKIQRNHLVIFVVVFASCLAVVLRISARRARAGAGDDSLLQPAAVALVRHAPIEESLALSGAFRPFQEVDVHAKVAGYIREIYVDVGDKVKQGQTLAILEVPELNAQVMGAEATIRRTRESIRRAQSQIQQAESAHTAAHFAYARLKQASQARPGLIAEQELDDALAKDQESEAQVSSARAALAEAQSELSVSEAERNRLAALEAYSHITAPFSGVVTKRYADTGALIQAGTSSSTQALPVVRLAEWSKLRLVLPVPESAVPQIHLGSVVNVRVAALNRTFAGKVARFADALDQATRTMETEIDVQNSDGTLVDGMYAETTLILNQKKNALTIPIEAVQRDESGSTVLVVDHEGRIRERQVKLGEEGNSRVEVLSGLAEKDEVVIGNHSQFSPGQLVQPRIIDETARQTEAGS
jgi:RND family efflux transporter MFP subunit